MSFTVAERDETLLHADALHNDAHFLRALSDMAQHERVVAGAAIYSDSGIKLLERGSVVDGQLYARLLQHRLAGAIDEHLLASNMVDIPALEAKVLLLSSTSELGLQLQRYLGPLHYRLQGVLRDVQWPHAISFKLTVMRQQMPQLFEHSVLMMMVAVSLGIRSNLSNAECADLAVGGLLHDVGMLYMPRSWMNPRHQLTTAESKQLAAHSITSMLVVRAAKVYAQRVQDAVLEHHERLDGSGYPRGLHDAEISSMGRILMMAEMVSAFYGKYSDMPAQRLSLALRMNRQRFDAALVQQVFALLGPVAVAPAAMLPEAAASLQPLQAAQAVMDSLATLLAHWQASRRDWPAQWQSTPGARAAMYIDSRLWALEQSLVESGAHPRQRVDWPGMLVEAPQCLTELALISKEAQWQMVSCVHTCLRRWPQLLQPANPLQHSVQQWLLQAQASLVGAQPAPPAGAQPHTGRLSE